jgi:hypothetical protein
VIFDVTTHVMWSETRAGGFQKNVLLATSSLRTEEVGSVLVGNFVTHLPDYNFRS